MTRVSGWRVLFAGLALLFAVWASPSLAQNESFSATPGGGDGCFYYHGNVVQNACQRTFWGRIGSGGGSCDLGWTRFGGGQSISVPCPGSEIRFTYCDGENCASAEPVAQPREPETQWESPSEAPATLPLDPAAANIFEPDAEESSGSSIDPPAGLPDSFPEFPGEGPEEPPSQAENTVAPTPMPPLERPPEAESVECSETVCFTAGRPGQFGTGTEPYMAALCGLVDAQQRDRRLYASFGEGAACIERMKQYIWGTPIVQSFEEFESAGAPEATISLEEMEESTFDFSCKWDGEKGGWVHTQMAGVGGYSFGECLSNALAIWEQDKQRKRESKSK